MQAISAGFFPDEWNQTFGAFRRLIEHLAEMQTMLTECGELTSENCDVTYIREQVKEEVATLAFMTREAETHWKALGVSVASAAGRLNLNRPADDVAWCSSVLNAAWNLHNGLSRELSGSDSEVCVQRLPLHLGRIPNDIQSWKDRIAAELRAGVLCIGQKQDFKFSRRTFSNLDIKNALNRRQDRGLRESVHDSTVDKFIRSEKGKGRIQREKKKPMRLRADLMNELNLADIDDP